MTGKQPLEILLSSYEFKCLGANKSRKPIFLQEQAEPVILKVYKDGKTEPLCRYVEMGCVAPRCNPKLIEGLSIRFTEDDLGICPYATKR